MPKPRRLEDLSLEELEAVKMWAETCEHCGRKVEHCPRFIALVAFLTGWCLLTLLLSILAR